MSTKIVNFFTDARYEEVVEETDRFLRTVPQNTTAVHLKAQALYQLGNYGECIRLLEKAIVYLVGREPLETRLQLAALLANAMLEEGRYEEVRDLVAHSVPEESTAREEYGELLLASAWASYFEGLFHLANAATTRIFDVSREHFTSGRAALCAALTARREGELHRGKAYLIKAQSHLAQARNLFGNPEPVRALFIVQAQIARRGTSEDLAALETEVAKLPQGSKMGSLLRETVVLYRRHLRKEPLAAAVSEGVRHGVKRPWVALFPGAQARRPTIMAARLGPEAPEPATPNAPAPVASAGTAADSAGVPAEAVEQSQPAGVAPAAAEGADTGAAASLAPAIDSGEGLGADAVEEVVPDMAAILPAVEPEPEYVPLEETAPELAALGSIPGLADGPRPAAATAAAGEAASPDDALRAESSPGTVPESEGAPSAGEPAVAHDEAASPPAESPAGGLDRADLDAPASNSTSASGIIRELAQAPHLESSQAIDDLFRDEKAAGGASPPSKASAPPTPPAPPARVGPRPGGPRPPVRSGGPGPLPVTAPPAAVTPPAGVPAPPVPTEARPTTLPVSPAAAVPGLPRSPTPKGGVRLPPGIAPRQPTPRGGVPVPPGVAHDPAAPQGGGALPPGVSPRQPTPRGGVPLPPGIAPRQPTPRGGVPIPPAARAPGAPDSGAIPVAPVSRDAGFTTARDVAGPPRRGPVVRTAADSTLLRKKNPPVGAILLVEPTDRVAKAFEDCIRDSSFRLAMRVGDIDSALEQYVLLRPTLVVVDLQSPGVTGLGPATQPAFVRMFLELDPHCKIVVLFTTQSKVMVMEALRQGARAQIEQPFERIRVLDALTKAMSARSSLEALRVPTLELRRPVACSWRPLDSGMRNLLEPWHHFVARSIDPMGLEASLEAALKVGSLVRLNIEIPGGDKPIQTLAEITSSKSEPALKLHIVRFSFVKLPADARDALVGFLMSAIEKAHTKAR